MWAAMLHVLGVAAAVSGAMRRSGTPDGVPEDIDYAVRSLACEFKFGKAKLPAKHDFCDRSRPGAPRLLGARLARAPPPSLRAPLLLLLLLLHSPPHLLWTKLHRRCWHQSVSVAARNVLQTFMSVRHEGLSVTKASPVGTRRTIPATCRVVK